MYKKRKVTYGKRKRRSGVIRGRGDYIAGSTAAPIINQLVGGSGQAPIRVNTGGDLSGDVYIHHREFIGNVFAEYKATGTSGGTFPSDFNNYEYPLNPGLSGSFPWLSQVAQNFTLFEFLGLVLEYRPTSSDYGSVASNSLGKVIMVTEYDPSASKFSNSVAMENYDYATSCKPSEHMAHGVETKPASTAVNMMYVRTGQSQKDKVFTDLGLFQIATEGIPVTTPTTTTAGATYKSQTGELWVTYKVRLSRANLYGSLLLQNVPYDYLTARSGGAGFTAGQAPLLNPNAYYYISGQSAGFGDFAALKSNNIGCSVKGDAANNLTISWPPGITSGTYQVLLWMTNPASGTAAKWPTVATAYTATNCVIYMGNPPRYGSTDLDSPPGTAIITANTPTVAAPSQVSMAVLWVTVQAPGNTIASIKLTLSPGIPAGNPELVVIVHGMPDTALKLGI